jgi:hypothetical protein
MISPRDKQILRFLERYNLGLTINQAAQIFFPPKFGYIYSRTRLRYLWKEMKALQRYTSPYTKEYIYYFDKKPTVHNNAVMNVYSGYVAAGYKITEFEPPEYELLGGKYKTDAFIKAETEEEVRLALVEVDLNTTTNIKKYEELYEFGEYQRRYGAFPLIVILTDVNRKYSNDNFEIVTLDIRCSDFHKVLI